MGLSPDGITSEYRARFEIAPPEQPSPLGDVDRHAHDSPVRRLAVLVFSVGLLIYGWLWTPADVPPAPSAADAVSTGVELDDTENIALATASSASASDEPALQLAIRPRGVCWVSATVDGQLVIYRLMKPGEPGEAVTIHITTDNYHDLLTGPVNNVREVRAIQPSTARWTPVLTVDG